MSELRSRPLMRVLFLPSSTECLGALLDVLPVRNISWSWTPSRVTPLVPTTRSGTTSNIIYLISCRICGIQYIGETTNSLKKRFYGHRSTVKIHKLYTPFQNSAARMLTRTRKFDHISSILIKLHWLPIRHRINFKLIMLTWKALHDMAPNYLCELLLPYTPKRTLRSTDKLLLTTPRTLSSYGDRAFYAAAPKLWNTLPLELRSCTSIDTFKKSLKTYLFEIAHDITTD